MCVCVCLAVSQYLCACGTQGSDHRHTSHAVSSSGREAMGLSGLCELDLHMAVYGKDKIKKNTCFDYIFHQH